ncbi:MAG: dihydroneopterin aldolase [Bacteroidetes bacterium]|jgi:dihydroneopterin aldolase|nr:dihydroneopterin aldolase [Bacteroidota bacterium]
MFFVFLDSQEVHCPVGVHEFERKSGVNLLISVRVKLRHSPDMDHIYHTLDYTRLVDIVNRVSAQERQLLETLASDIATAIHKESDTGIENIHIRIEKPYIPHEGYRAKSCGIEFTLNCQ